MGQDEENVRYCGRDDEQATLWRLDLGKSEDHLESGI